MNDSTFWKSLSPFAAIVILLLGTGGVWYLDQPLKPWRPAAPKLPESSQADELYVRARLWEDPLQAVYRKERETSNAQEGGGGHSNPQSDKERPQSNGLEALQQHLGDALRPGGKGENGTRVLILPVLIAGQTYDVSFESRLRSRFSILAALKHEGFTQDEWDHLLYFRTRIKCSQSNKCELVDEPPSSLKAKGASNSEDQAQLFVPYEWFTWKNPNNVKQGSSEEKLQSRALVLWLGGEVFEGSFLLSKLTALIGSLVKGLDPAATSLPKVCLIGPTWSSTLHEILEDLNKNDYSELAKLNFGIYSPWATGDWEYLKPSEIDSNRICPSNKDKNEIHPTEIWQNLSRQACSEAPGKDDIAIEKTIAEDGQLAKELVYELSERGVKFEKKDSILLISEWDQLYGQIFRNTFQKQRDAFQKQKDKSQEQKDNSESSQKVPSIIIPQAIYLMGLDGKLPGEMGKEESSSPSASGKDKLAAEDIERPDGRSQIDYLRRLADRLADSYSDRLQAIGILGSDIYDKLLILEALRDRLPHVIFFTTDLDAHFLHPSQRRWTRNLIVASSFSLYTSKFLPKNDKPSLEPEYVPPLRDTYQTSMYVAAIKALQKALLNRPEEDSAKLSDLSPKLFEIGRTQLIELDSPVPNKQPDNREARWWLIAILAASGVFAIGPAGLATRYRYLQRKKEQDPFPWLTWLWFGAFALAVLLMLFEVFCYCWPTVKEPFAWFQGVSIWPSAILRTLAAILAAFLLAWVHRQAAKNNQSIGAKFLIPKMDSPSALPKTTRWFERFLYCICIKPKPASGKYSVAEIWAEFQSCERSGARWKWIIILSLLYGGVAFVLINICGSPHVPYRGDFSQWAANVPLFICVALQIALTFFVVDATFICTRLVRRLSEGGNQWPESAAKGWGVSEEIADEALAIDLIAQKTKVVGNLIYCPFAVLLLVILSRNSYFDRWDWPLSLLLISLINSLLVLIGLAVLWLSARKARQWALEGLEAKRMRLGSDQTRHVEYLIEQVRSVREGAFAPLSENPIILALIMPLGGISVTSLLDLLSNAL
jgi:hypothetical protein